MSTFSRCELPIWRSLMFVPADVPRYIEKAPGCGADGLILDLEDSVAPARKSEARARIRDSAATCGRAGADILVRINRPLQLAIPDIEASICPGVHALVLPKIASPEHVRLLAEVVSEMEQAQGMQVGRTQFLVVVEDAAGLQRVDEIAAAHERIVGCSAGNEDLAFSMGVEPEFDVLVSLKQRAIVAARAANVLPLGLLCSGTNFRDLDAYRTLAAKSRRFGLAGSTCIHPSQVAVLNAAFSPTATEIENARRVVEAFSQSMQSGRGAAGLDGKMIDAPVMLRAQRILAQADARTGLDSLL